MHLRFMKECDRTIQKIWSVSADIAQIAPHYSNANIAHNLCHTVLFSMQHRFEALDELLRDPRSKSNYLQGRIASTWKDFFMNCSRQIIDKDNLLWYLALYWVGGISSKAMLLNELNMPTTYKNINAVSSFPSNLIEWFCKERIFIWSAEKKFYDRFITCFVLQSIFSHLRSFSFHTFPRASTLLYVE